MKQNYPNNFPTSLVLVNACIKYVQFPWSVGQINPSLNKYSWAMNFEITDMGLVPVAQIKYAHCNGNNFIIPMRNEGINILHEFNSETCK